MTKITPAMTAALEQVAQAHEHEALTEATAERRYRELVEAAIEEATSATDRAMLRAREAGVPMNRIATAMGVKHASNLYPRWNAIKAKHEAAIALRAPDEEAERNPWTATHAEDGVHVLTVNADTEEEVYWWNNQGTADMPEDMEKFTAHIGKGAALEPSRVAAQALLDGDDE